MHVFFFTLLSEYILPYLRVYLFTHLKVLYSTMMAIVFNVIRLKDTALYRTPKVNYSKIYARRRDAIQLRIQYEIR